MKKLRALSLRQVTACENAHGPKERCKCRCGGEFHGAGRLVDLERRDFENLNEGDPHKLPVKMTAKEKREAKWRALQRDLDLAP